MARPPITLSPDQVREVETLAALLNQDQIAARQGAIDTGLPADRLIEARAGSEVDHEH